MEPWTVASTVALQAYRQRALIFEIGTKVWRKVAGRKIRVVVTGEAGAGKSVLALDLVEQLSSTTRLPYPSDEVETFKRRRNRVTVQFKIIPGQSSTERLQALISLFTGRTETTGFLHVVANGFNSPRDEAGRQAAATEANTLLEYRTAWLAQEEADLRAIAGEIAKHYAKHRSRTWLVLAVNKVDLFSDEEAELEAKVRYHSPAGRLNSILRQLQLDIGALDFHWVVVQVSAVSEPFEFHGEVVRSELSRSSRMALQANMYDLIERLGRNAR